MHLATLRALFSDKSDNERQIEDVIHDDRATKIVASALKSAFDWGSKKEGVEFWTYVYNRLVEITAVSKGSKFSEQLDAITGSAVKKPKKNQVVEQLSTADIVNSLGKGHKELDGVSTITPEVFEDMAAAIDANLLWSNTAEGSSFWAYVHRRLQGVSYKLREAQAESKSST